MNPTLQMWLLVLFGLCAGLSVVYAIKKAWTEKDLLPIYLIIAATITVSVEPFVDLLGLCWHPEQGQIVGYRCFGRLIPLHIIFCFMFYFGPGITYLVYRLRKGNNASWLLKFFFIAVAMAFVFEPIILHFNGWIYYGNQPLRIFQFPIWWPFVNAACVILAGVIIFRALPYLNGWEKILVIPMMPTAAAATHTLAGFPVYAALNTLNGGVVTSLGSIATIFMSVFYVWLAGFLISEKPVTVSVS